VNANYNSCRQFFGDRYNDRLLRSKLSDEFAGLDENDRHIPYSEWALYKRSRGRATRRIVIGTSGWSVVPG
jgi:hypothetical protein